MALDMRKTLSYLKGLAEFHARAAGAVLRNEQRKTELETLLSQLRPTSSDIGGSTTLSAGALQTRRLTLSPVTG